MGSRFPLATQFTRFLRWLLFLWVRVEVFPDNDPAAAMAPDRPTLYVLADRGLSDLLLVAGIARARRLPDPQAPFAHPALAHHHSVYSVASRSPMIDWLRHRRKHSVMLSDMLDAATRDPSLDFQVVPVSVFWGRPLARQKHFIQVMFADRWALAGRTRKFFTLLIHGRNARVIFSQAQSFREILAQTGNDEHALQDYLIEALTSQREATFGPQITPKRRLAERVVETDEVQEIIVEKPEQKLQRFTRAHRYCREIFADCSQFSIELMLRLLRVFWNRYYDAIEVYNIEPVREAALSHQLVYVPCHRSHVDYLLLSYVIYEQNLAIPYIAAGNNLNVPVIGRILRGGGAFFLRRSFRDNPLYGAVLRGYLRQLVQLNVPLEYFVEGGRSRTGRMLKPKFGMLGMTVEAQIKSSDATQTLPAGVGATKPLAFVPVYFGYEKLIEGKSYLGELYGGKKKRETTLGALAAIFHLKGHFGRVTASFGDPIVLDDLLDRHCADWRSRSGELATRPDWYQASLHDLAERIMHGINRACVINPVNSVATILLATQRQSIEIEELIAQARLHRRLIRKTPTLSSIRVAAKVTRREIERIAKQKIVHIRKHELGDIVYLEPEDAVLSGYYRNNSLHALIVPALIACCFINAHSMSRAGVLRKIRLLYPFLRSELQLEWSEEKLETLVGECCDSMIQYDLLEAGNDNFHRPRRSNPTFTRLMRLGQIVQPILERYYMTFIVLWQSAADPLTEDEIEYRCHLLAQKISMIYGINSPDFFDRPLFRDFIDTMLDNEYLLRNADGRLEFSPGFDYIALDLRNLLSSDVRSSILSLIKSAPGEHSAG